MALADRSASAGRNIKRKPRRPPAPSPRSEAVGGSGYSIPARVPPRHTTLVSSVFTNPLMRGGALHEQRKSQREKVRLAQDRLGPVVRLPRRPTLASYTPAQRREIIASTSRAVREAAASGRLDDFFARKRGDEMLLDQLGHLADRETRRAVHKYAGAVRSRQRHLDALLGAKVTQGRLSPVFPSLANLAEIGRKVRERRTDAAMAGRPRLEPGAPPEATNLADVIFGSIGRTLNTNIFGRVANIPLQLGLATVEKPAATAKSSVRTGIESIAGIPQGVKMLVEHPGKALEGMAQDYVRRYGPVLAGNDAEFRRRVQQESGLTPFILDTAGAGALGGRAAGAVARAGFTARAAEALARANEPILSRVLRAAHETATRQRPSLRFSGGEAGVVPQATSRNLFVAAGQRGLDAARRRKFAKQAEQAGVRPAASGRLERIPGREQKRLAGLRPQSPNEVLAFYSPREAAPIRRLTGRVARDIGAAKGKGRLRLLMRRGAALKDLQRAAKGLTADEQALLMPVVKYGLPAVVNDASRAAAVRVIERRIAQLRRQRKQSGFRGTPPLLRATNDEMVLLRALRKNPEALTPRLRKAADDMLAVQRREETLDPDLPADRALIRRVTEQGKVLGVRRGPDEMSLRDRLDEIALVGQARGRGVTPQQLRESHGALASMLPERRPQAARLLETQAKARLGAAERAVTVARENVARATGRAEILSRNVTGTRAGELAVGRGMRLAGGGLGVAVARRALDKAQRARKAASDAYRVAQEVTQAVKSKSTMRLEPADVFDARVRKAAKEAGLREPGYWASTPRPAETYSDAAIGAGGRAVAGSRRYTGALSDIGVETHTPGVLARGIERNIKRRFSWSLVNRNMDVHAFEWSRGPHGEGMTAQQILRELDERQIDAGSMAFINARVVRSRDQEQAGVVRGDVVETAAAEDPVLAQVNQELRAARTTLADLQAEGVQGQAINRYLVVPKQVADELEHATRPDGAAMRAMEIVLKQKPARILLGALNVPWLSFQMASNALLTGLGGGRNPLDVYGAHKWWRGLTDAEKDAVEIELGITHGRHFAIDQTHLGSTKDHFGPAKHIVDFWQAYKKSRVGRLAHKGNPLDLMFRADEAQNNFFRKVLFYSQAKKTAYARMGANWRSLDGLQKKAMQALAVPPERMGGAIAARGREFEAHAKTVNDFLGNYLTFSNRERQLLSRNIMFYGYLRFSLRFTFWTMPVEHPVITALLGNLGRLGADEIKKLFGVEDTYRLPTSMLAKIYSGSPKDTRNYIESGGLRGKLPESVNIGRMNPALNAITQLESEQQLIGLTSPLYQALADQLFEESSFTGRDYRIMGRPTPAETQRPKNYFGSFWSTFIPGRPRNRILMSDLLGLVYPYRLATKTGIPGVVGPLEGPQSDDSLLGSARPMRYKDETIRRSIARSIERERQNRRLLPQILPFAGQEDLGPLIVARERQREADAANQRMPASKKRRRTRAGSASRASQYGGGSSGSSYRSRYGG